MARSEIADLAIVNGLVLTFQDASLTPLRGSILIRDGRISAITPERNPKARETISAEGKLVMPGFVDAHCHSIHMLLRGLSNGLHYHEWLEKLMYKALPHYTPADARVAAELFCAEAIKSGITTIGDSTDFGNRTDLVEATLAGFRKAGMRAVYFRNFSDAPPPGLGANKESAQRALKQTEALMASRYTRNGLLEVGLGINEPHFVTPQGFRKAVILAEKKNARVMAHIAEIEADVIIDGENVVDWMMRHNLLSPQLVLAHCVWLGRNDFRKIAASGASITWQPSTNAFLADGVMPVRYALDAGLAIGLGTDDANASDQVNMFTEMRTGALLTKSTSLDPTAITPTEMLAMATRGGARALGLGERIGSLSVGKAADMIIIDLKALQPFTNLASALVYQASGPEVETVLINGRVVMRERQLTTLDERALRAKAQRSIDGIVKRSSLDLPSLSPNRGESACSYLFETGKSSPLS